MQILDKNKDYYDCCQFEFGPVDKTVTYDRRGSFIIQEKLFYNCYSTPILILEVGFIQYLIEFKTVKWIDSFLVHDDMQVINKFEENIHLGQEPVSLFPFKIVNSEIDKAVNHGFDKKTSFRHPIR